MNTDKDNKPLWKVVFDATTIGKTPGSKMFLDDTHANKILSDGINGWEPLAGENVIGGTVPDHPDKIANAQYMVLSFNNLHILAEALENLMNKAKENHSIYFNTELKAGMEALKNIS